MKTIILKCPCGASIQLEDAAESYILPDGRPDKRGRRYLIEVRSDEWLDRHADCITIRNKMLCQPKISPIKRSVERG